MKKTLTINLNDTVYDIDEDAFSLLKKYLNNIRYYFRNEKGVEEIMRDIESRISELFSEGTSLSLNVISKERVEEIIEQLGRPEEIAGDEYMSGEANDKEYHRKKRKIYRDPDDKMLGGVISGLAAYLGVDTTTLRLLAVLCLIFSLSTLVVVYLVCWLIIPEAKTAEEKLSMRGEDINLQNIGKTVTESFNKAQEGINSFVKSKDTRTKAQRFIDGLVDILGVLLKVALIIVLISIGMTAFIVLLLLFLDLVIGGLSALFGGGIAFFSMFPFLESPFFIEQSTPLFMSSISGLIVLGLPVFAILYVLFQHVFKWKNMNRSIKTTLIVLWIIALLFFIFGLLQINWGAVNMIDHPVY
ncbi:MAG: PspC domain-containing protein [Bacteroidales bacterium]|nr:PspC domain-containing protein [Bacteroidales bacterium]